MPRLVSVMVAAWLILLSTAGCSGSGRMTLDLAKIEQQRVRHLKDSGAVSQEEVDERDSPVAQAEANVAGAAAALESADLNMTFTRVTSPIDGRVSRAEVTRGPRYRRVKLGRVIDGLRIVREGLKPGDVEARWRTTLASIPTLEASIATTLYRLSVLTGRQPAVLTERLTPQPAPKLPPLNSIGTPEQLLRRRPDIRIAERRLGGATARVGVAVGDLFPKVTLTGRFGYLAPTFGDLGQSEAKFFSIGPGTTSAAFDLGRVCARISSARAETDAALASYEGAVLNALEDTEGALVSYGRSQ